MKDKVRYELLNYCIYDNKLKQYVCSPCASMKVYMKILTYLLNQQDKQIELLEEGNRQANINNYLADFFCAVEENRKLKQQLYDLKNRGCFYDKKN